MNNSMTGTIYLSNDSSIKIIQSTLNQQNDYIEKRNKFFKNLSDNMNIHRVGTNSFVEFNDLDLSSLDIIFKEDTS